MASTEEAKELNLVGKVEMRIALADSESKLQTLLLTYLCPLLLKLTSQSKAVREKVISICQHVSTRLKSNTIKLPVEGLLRQFKQNRNSLVRHFDLLYFQQGLSQMPVHERRELFPIILGGLAENYEQSPQNTAVLFNVLLRLLNDVSLPPRGTKDDLELRSKWGLDTTPQDARFVSQWIGKLVLFSGSVAVKNGPGLSVQDWEFLLLYGKTSTWDPAGGGLRLTDTKAAAVKLLASGAFTDNERFLPALCASADGQSRVAEVGEDILKRASSAISLEDAELVESLFSLYHGTKQDPARPAVRGPLKIKIVGLLSRSQLATNYAEKVVQMVKECLALEDGSEGPAQKGLEASKLRRQVFAFINWVARMASESTRADIAPKLIGDLRAYIEGQGWPRAGEEVIGKNSPEISARNYGYETVGLLAKSCPREILIEPNLDLLRWLLRSLVSDNSSAESNISIESALASVLAVLSTSDLSSVEEPFIELLSHFMNLKEGDQDAGAVVSRSARYTVVRFANRCLPYDNFRARWIDALALSTGKVERHEIVEEGQKGLDPYWYQKLNPFKDSTQSAHEEGQHRYQMPLPQELIEFFFVAHHSNGAELGPAFSTAAVFCRNILLHKALEHNSMAPEVDVDWQRQLEASVSNDQEARQCIIDYIQTRNDAKPQSVLSNFVAGTLRGLTTEGFGDAAATGQVLLELIVLAPSVLVKEVAGNLSSLVPVIYSSKSEIQRVSSHVFGIAAASASVTRSERDAVVSTLLQNIRSWKDAVGAAIHRVQGSIISLGYLFSRLSGNVDIHGLQDAKAEVVPLYLSILFKASDKALIGAVLNALDQLCIFGALQIDTLPSEFDAKKLIEKLAETAKSGNEDAVSCLGHFAMLCPENVSEESLVMHINDILLKLHEVRQPELHFGVGAAFACLSAGTSSKSLTSVIDFDGHVPLMPTRENLLELVVLQVLDKCKQTKPALRQASVIWLLCLVQFCGHLPELTGRLRVIQKSFMGFLSDRDSLNQETASRGLGLVYEKGDRAIKDDLVRDLVNSFTTTKSNLAGTVDEETELFEPGALPTGDGSVTTYKDIVNLAREVGDPSLVYRFMSLASNNSIWSSRAAFGRFGLSKILSDSSVDGYLSQNPKLYPVLFRYRFDPNSNVRSAMNEIWATLVKDPTAVIENNFDRIINDLLVNILGKEWRTRQASCAAIGDLVQGRPLSIYEKYLTQIWEATFKVCDDIKGSVREAAMGLARVLTGILIRSLETGDGSSSATDAMLTQVLPFLGGPSGLHSRAQEVRGFAGKTLVDIAKKGNSKSLRPHLSELIAGNLLPALSAFEPEEINYLHLNAQRYGTTEEDIDDARLSAVRASPLMEGIERCLDLLDESNIKEFSEHFTKAMSTVIGLPAAVGSSRILVSLSTRRGRLFQPYAAPFLKHLQRNIMDLNRTISMAACTAAGYICRIVDNKAILGHISYSRSLFWSEGDSRKRWVSGELFLNLVKHAADRVRELASSIFPLVCLAQHDDNDNVRDLYKSVWEELSGNSRTILLYSTEIIDLAAENLDSPVWTFKHAAAFVIADVIKALGTDVSAAHAQRLWPPLKKALQAKTWDGKEKLLDASVSFVSNSATVREDPEWAEEAKKQMIREAKRRNTGVYREHAMQCLGQITEIFDSDDWFEQVLPIVDGVFESLEEAEDEMDVDTGGRASTKTVAEKTRGNAIRTLLQSVNPKLRTGTKLDESLTHCLDKVQNVGISKDAPTQGGIFEGEKLLFQKLREAKDATVSEKIVTGFLKTLDTQEMGAEATRIKAAEAAESIVAVAWRVESARKGIAEIVTNWLDTDRSYAVQQILQRLRREVLS